MTFQVDDSMAFFDFLVQLQSAPFTESPPFKMFLRFVFHLIRPPVMGVNGGKEYRWSECSGISSDMQDAAAILTDAAPYL